MLPPLSAFEDYLLGTGPAGIRARHRQPNAIPRLSIAPSGQNRLYGFHCSEAKQWWRPNIGG
jgi:hypothetical protein